MTNLTVFKTARSKMQSIRSPSSPNPKSKTQSTIEIETNTYLTNSSSQFPSIRSPSGPNPKSKTPSTNEIETNT